MKPGLTLESFYHEGVVQGSRTNHSRETPSNLTARINGTKSSDSTDNKEVISLESMSHCSRFEDCPAPKCPLDTLIDLRSEIEEDPQCEMAKATRHKYWQSMGPELRSLLPFQGYFESEYNRMRSARERWATLSEERKAEIRERMRNVRSIRE